MFTSRSRGILLVVSALVCGCAHSQTQSADIRIAPGVQEQLEAAMKESAAAWNRGDVDNFLAVYKNDTQTAFMAPQITYGVPDIKARYLRTYFKDGKPSAQLTYDDLKYRSLGGNYVLMTGRWHLTDSESGKKQDGYYSLVWEKTPSGWKIIHDHSS